MAHVDGWSFPHEHVRQSPLEEYEFGAAEIPVLGLLHADLDAPESEYAPVTRSELEATPADAWLLGHIHAPAVRVEAEPTVFYPGSPQPLDPGEPGAHGPWMVRCGTSADIEIEQLPLATVRYDEVEIDVTDLEDPRDLPGAVTASVDEYVTENVETGALRLLSARIKLVGETPAHGALVRQREALEADLGFRAGGIQVRVDRLDIDTRPAVDLEELATEDTPVGYLAGLLLDLESGGEPQDLDRILLDETTDAIREARSAGAYAPLRRAGRLPGMETEADRAKDVLRRQARLLLHELLEQTGDER
jgi:DNA repair exonuclease SbcCD nuclease subunit